MMNRGRFGRKADFALSVVWFTVLPMFIASCVAVVYYNVLVSPDMATASHWISVAAIAGSALFLGYAVNSVIGIVKAIRHRKEPKWRVRRIKISIPDKKSAKEFEEFLKSLQTKQSEDGKDGK